MRLLQEGMKIKVTDYVVHVKMQIFHTKNQITKEHSH